jgi:hypothetical protein
MIASFIAIMPTRPAQPHAPAVERLAEILTMRRQLSDAKVAAENALVDEIKAVIGEMPTYGYRKGHLRLARRFYNPKNVVPPRSNAPRASRCPATASNTILVSSCASSRCRKFKIVVSSGIGSRPSSRLQNARIDWIS